MRELDAGARAGVQEYLGRLDAVLPDAWVYLTGSAALGDWQSGHSDLDILTVTERPLDAAGLDALEGLHAALPGRPYRDAVYVHRDNLGARPPGGSGQAGSSGQAGVPHVIDGVFRRTGQELDPVLWATLDQCGLTVRGPAAATLGAGPDPEWLREWNLGNLTSYWRSWAADSRKLLAPLPPDAPLPAEAVAWGALGPGRLHATIATGRIISKTAAADYAAEHFGDRAGVLARAKAWRLGDETVTFTAADGQECCGLVDAIVTAGSRASSG